MTQILSAGKTHTGNVRDHNEDTIFNGPDHNLWIVADGMGGHACGEVASQITVNTLQSSIDQGQPLIDALAAAHTAVTSEAQNNSEALGMGTTVVLMTVNDEQFEIAWVGDSRAYLLRGQQLHLLTRDHSYLEWLKDNGVTVDEARNHPKRNIITQSIGVGEPAPDKIHGDVEPGDRFLLCSDGLNDELTDEEIANILAADGHAEEVTGMLIEAALEQGGRDNVSVIVVDVEPERRDTQATALVGSIKAVVNKLFTK